MNNVIRAYYTGESIRVYQAYNPRIANSAVKHQKFLSPPFKMERATWIKPSFLWMMYRAGWATKVDQERILAIDITHEGFQWAVRNSCLSHYDSTVYQSPEQWAAAKLTAPVVIQWDPERDIQMNKLDYRAIQIGLTPPAVKLYTEEWVLRITDITPEVNRIKSLLDQGHISDAQVLLPVERSYYSLGE